MKTMRNILIGFLAALAVPASGALISRIYTFQDGQVLTASQLNSEFNNVVNGVNSIDNANVSATANIDPIKLSSSIAGAGLSRDSGTGYLSVNTDGTGLEVIGDTVQIKDLGVTTAKLAATSVTAAKLNSNVVDNSTLEHNSGTLRVKDLGIVTAKINDLAVTSGKIADGAVTQAKRVVLGQQISNSSGAFSTTSATYVDVTNLTVTITTSGRPVHVFLINDGTESAVGVGPVGANTTFFKFLRGSTDLCFESVNSGGTSLVPASSFHCVDAPVAGTYTYKLQIKSQGGILSYCSNAKLVAYEL